MISRPLLAATLFIALASNGLHAQAAKTDPALNKLADAFEMACKAKDAAKVGALYAEDAVLMPPNEPMVKGRTAIQGYWAKQFQQGITGIDLTPIESRVSGDQAFEAGRAVVTINPGASKPGGSGTVTDNAKYVVVYKRVAGEWKLAYDVFNSDAAPMK
jgi:uncharacterized protein (TIGR02246 family)